MNRIKKIFCLAMISTLMAACLMACGADKKTGDADYVTYTFETFEGDEVTIDASNIISQEEEDDVFETTKVPSDAEVIAPGRDFVYLADDSYYYVEDSINRLVTKASK